MSNEITIGVIGVGIIGKNHLRKYQDIEGANVIAAADLDAQELTRVKDEFSLEDTYTDFREILKRDDIDAVDICLHNNLHMPVTTAALEAGKHVYCEKPMAGSYVDAVAMMECSKKCGKKLSIQLATLFSSEVKSARRLIDDGHLGRIYHARSTGYRRRGRPFVDGYATEAFVKKEIAAGGALYDMGVYHIAQMLYLLGIPRVERISGKIYQETDMDEKRRKKSGYNVEELGLGFIKFKDGVTLDIIEAWAIHLDKFEGSSIVGSKGGIRMDPFGFFTVMSDIDMDGSFNLKAADGRRHSLDENETAFDSAQNNWIAALLGKSELLPSAELALSTMLISEGIYLSDHLGREVSAEEVLESSVSTAIKI